MVRGKSVSPAKSLLRILPRQSSPLGSLVDPSQIADGLPSRKKVRQGDPVFGESAFAKATA